MCGVIGLIYEHQRDDLGHVASELLKTLEYRGYDSTGGAFQGDGQDVRLLKGVGAPSLMVHQLGITRMGGRAFCGQVRWATFGAVTDENSQPHVVRCQSFLYGAHNGNVTNCDDLKAWLISEGHDVLSDNDGEMVVHTVEHFFARELKQVATRAGDADTNAGMRCRAMRRALLSAAANLEGSFAAVIVDPVTHVMWAVKQGSSLYFGLGTDPVGGRFAIASSDLSSVLKLTRIIVPIIEGEFVEYAPLRHQIYSIEDRTVRTPRGTATFTAGQAVDREPMRSRLRAKDAALAPPFTSFMDQEIHAQAQAVRGLVTLFFGGSEAARAFRPPADLGDIVPRLDALRDEYDDERMRRLFYELADDRACRAMVAAAPESITRATHLHSGEAGFFADVLPMARDRADTAAVHVLDAMLEAEEVREFALIVEGFGRLCLDAIERRGRIYAICCGSSYHAAKAASVFFNELARVDIQAVLPGEFRGQSARSLRDGDLVIAVSQSGETKDLIDVLNDVIASGRDVRRISLVNNVNSTIAEEKSDLVIPLRCGPEIAVPATKSFMNQMVLFFCLALHLAERRVDALVASGEDRDQVSRDLESRREQLRSLPALIRETIDTTDADIEVAAALLHLRPSLHLLATRLSSVAMEGALKIREVVLNHTEGFEASEFKHGPNTILGVNTVLGPEDVDAMLRRLSRTCHALAARAGEAGLGAGSVQRLTEATMEWVFRTTSTPFALNEDERAIFERTVHRADILAGLVADYPLVYITGPSERDVAITVSQINTHKIRGASTVIIAEEHPALRGAAAKPPVDNAAYRSVYITLPRTNDTLMAAFSATVALQRLALKMSLLKKHHLDRLGIANHGVDPDAPKNVSKSITVD
jgi:glucosamine 6-phosphate synthetase-like amidotransferase/phosphosugar isomerase protein